MLKIGITGGIGSGKTFVCSIFECMGYPVFYSDKIAKEIIENDLDVKSELKSIFGEDIYVEDTLNRKRLAAMIFSNKSLLTKVNSIIHPKVRSEFNAWCQVQKSSFVLNEAAILFETDAYKTFDATILITAPQELKIQRISLRDFITFDEIKSRMDNQLSDDKKIKLATLIINNDEKQPLLSQIEEVIFKLENS